MTARVRLKSRQSRLPRESCPSRAELQAVEYPGEMHEACGRGLVTLQITLDAARSLPTDRRRARAHRKRPETAGVLPAPAARTPAVRQLKRTRDRPIQVLLMILR